MRVNRRKEARGPKCRRALVKMGTIHETVDVEGSQADELGEMLARWHVEDLPIPVLDRGMFRPLVQPSVCVSLERVLYHGLNSADGAEFTEPESKREMVEIGREKGQDRTSIMDVLLLNRTHVEGDDFSGDGVGYDP